MRTKIGYLILCVSFFGEVVARPPVSLTGHSTVPCLHCVQLLCSLASLFVALVLVAQACPLGALAHHPPW